MTSIGVRGDGVAVLLTQKKVVVSCPPLGTAPSAPRTVDRVALVLNSGVALPSQDKLVDPTYITHLYSITDKIGCVLTGIKREPMLAFSVTVSSPFAETGNMVLDAACYVFVADGLQLLQKAREKAAEFKYNYGYEIPVHYLAKIIADENQVRLACLSII